MKRSFIKHPVTAGQERGTVNTYRNRRNPNKHIEVKKGNDGHSYARQYLKWDTPEGEVKNYIGARTSRGRYFRSRRDTIDQMLEDYDPVECADGMMLNYTFYFGDGSAAASRGELADEHVQLSGTVSSEAIAASAVTVLEYLSDGFTDEDVITELGFEPGDEIELPFENLEEAINSLDIGAGEPLVYKVERNGEVVYYDEYLEREISHTSQFSFDFLWNGEDYDEGAIQDAVESVFDSLELDVLGTSFESVDYSSYSDYADKNVSQCSVDFEWSEDYDEAAIENMIEESVASLGHTVIGTNFYSLDE